MSKGETRKAWNAKQRAAGLGLHPRDNWGCIVTIRNQTTRECLTRHFSGYRLAALRTAAAWCDAQGPEWLVASYSTPATILSDVAGARVQEHRSTRDAYTNFPEANALAKIGRLDLCPAGLLTTPPRAGKDRA